ncbi:RNA 3'-terminal phosphate cyclase [Haloparvum sedimenti]|uniref:RNA 3'-terminal phosphate cyclase n=1 Tax=Haloparvum sedimenti TaxID=1678448 RepID=UPI00071E8220|nr:RNA 3'-terminal phosphate cyclase [Haloparvum sedimenti]
MLEIDGSAGGGQLLRTALSLSALTDTPFRMTDVRGERPTPGLKAQHAACVRAAAAIADAEVEGGSVGDDAVTFEPGEVIGGEYTVSVATAGSLTLVFETVLPLAIAAEAPITLHATGGTDVAWSPPLDYLRRVKLPLLARHGLLARVETERRGFYPSGNGAARLTLAPSSLDRIDLREPVGSERIGGVRVFAAASADLAEADAAERLAATAAEELTNDGHEVTARAASYGPTASTGAVVTIRADASGDGGAEAEAVPDAEPNAPAPAARPTAGVSTLGESGTPAEATAREAADRFRQFRDSPGAVDRHLADQLVLPVALAGGAVAVPTVTDHLASCVTLVERFGIDVEYEERATGGVLLRADGVR